MSELLRSSDDWYWSSEFAVSDELPEFDLTAESPAVNIETALGRLVLHWGNTKLFTFTEKWSHMDHIYHQAPGLEQPVYMFEADQELTDVLFEHNFMHIFSPFPTRTDMEMYHSYLRGDEFIEDIGKRLTNE